MPPTPTTKRLDDKIWEVVTDCFLTDRTFTSAQATERCREHIPEIGRLPYDYAFGRVHGALSRLWHKTRDLRSLTLEPIWILPSR